MSELLFLDSFDHLVKDDMTYKWTSVSTNTTVALTTSGRTASGLVCAADYGQSFQGSVHKGVPQNTTLTAGMAFKTSNLDSIQGIMVMSNYPLNINAGGHAHCVVRLRPEGAFDVLVWNGRLATSPQVSSISDSVIRKDVWYYLEVKMTLVLYLGAYSVTTEIRVNNITVLTDSVAADTQTNLGLNWVGFGGHNQTIDDVYITTDYFLGDVKIAIIRPESDHGPNDWTPLGTATASHFDEVNDITLDEMSSYITSTATGDQELYEMTDPNLTGEIMGIQTNIVSYKDDAGPGTIKAMYYIGTSTYYGAERAPSYLAWSDMLDCALENPATSAPYTPTEINDLVAGVERIT